MEKKFIFKRELFELTCQYKMPQPGEKEFEHHLTDIRSEHSFSETNDGRTSHSLETKHEIVRSIYYSEYTEEDRKAVAGFVEYSAQEKGVTIEERVERITDDRPWWKIRRVWMEIAAIGSFIVGIMALLVSIIALIHHWAG
jgi:hypothetical protein